MFVAVATRCPNVAGIETGEEVGLVPVTCGGGEKGGALGRRIVTTGNTDR